MIRTAFIAVLALVALASNAEARQRHKATGLHPQCNIVFPCTPSISTGAVTEGQRVARGRYIAHQMGFGGAIERRPVRAVKARKALTGSPQALSGVGPATTFDSGQLINSRKTNATIVSHPSGCPSRAFCGCGAAVRVFGSPVRSLWLAANWLRFPRTSPAPGMVAARRGHVFVLEADLGNGLWQVYDANSGRGLTRVHARSLAGYQIVNPRAG